ncbi:MAG: GNAT family protein [Sporichthyaceae bacterium]
MSSVSRGRPRLVTDRLELVPQSLAAVRALVEGREPGMPLAEGYPHADSLDGMRIAAAHADEDADMGGWFIVRVADGAVIGDLGTKGGVDERGRVEIGYGLSSNFRRQGYGGEAVGALVAWLGTQPGVRAVTAEVEVGNDASRRLLERLGFVVEDTADGSWWLSQPVASS